ncbi:MAG: MBL fold metallo-hydrolase [Tannerella sp.]|jgi:glyoxylase-like metal-dependent hydrolase (beta-lactamase superfamily II)|nr:MBL fold metallo-hydrolase [Tannerella sp.]
MKTKIMKTKKLILLMMLLSFASHIPAQEGTEPITFGVGAFSVTTMPEVQQQGKTDILIGATDDILNKYTIERTYRTAINAFLIETDGQTILVDAGLGRNLINNLEKCKKKEEDIKIVLLTHLHGDHIGGLLKEGKKTFPYATLYISQAEYDYWTNDDIMQSLPENRRNGFINVRKMLNIYKDHLRLFVPGEHEDTTNELLPGIRAIAAYGHTPGHTTYLFTSDGYQLLIWGDVTHATSVQIPCPQVAVTYDTDSSKAVDARRRIMKYVSEKGIRVAGMHIEYPGLIDIKGDESKGYTCKLLCVCEGVYR